MRFVVAAAFVTGLALFAVSCQTRTETGSSTAAADSATRAATIEAGHVAFLSNCAMCHGDWGAGDGPLAGELQQKAGVKPAMLIDRARLGQIGRAEVIKVIQSGGGHTGRSNLMPAWSERLDHATIERIADFIMSLPDTKPGTPSSVVQAYLAAPPGSAPEGRRLFVMYCTSCHGPEGHGDGVYADTLWARNQIRPRDLRDSVYLAPKTDQELFVTVSLGGAHGGKSSYMPAWSVTLPPDQIKDLVSYVRAVSHTTSPATP